ncbi:MAG: cupin domain-containing protein [Gammaproteobacteria bacterium]|nr:cupin domain-containing protein [Gammaproteobacteria bacterium]MDD9895967.1 cupin domain-containing protein [Gammaproteobacteria bacterium]MDD9958618.1 cupin domain-containing protein [Gammaproteobacteria bacterium]
MNAPRLNPQFDPAAFLLDYWQKRPLLIPGMVEFTDPLSPEELAGLACEDGIESRLVLGAERWRLRHGPFLEADFTALSSSNWTLLVQGIDSYINEFSTLRDLFKFIPHWRLDDVMASYAAPGGGVGPHFDYYDVFLVQGSGQRSWQLGKKNQTTEPVQTESGLSLLTEFEPEQEFILNPGDVLYIPPQYGHWGSAITESFCYSVGFRAPSAGEMLEGFSDALIARADPACRFTNTVGEEIRNPHEIGLQDLTAAYALVQDELANFDGFCKWFGAYMTQPKYPELFQGLEKTPSAEALGSAIRSNQLDLLINPATRLAFTLPVDRPTIYLFIDGRVYTLSQSNSEAVKQLFEPTFSFNSFFSTANPSEEIQDLILAMLAEGSLLMRPLAQS